jgi:hypothetical protein
MCSSCKQIAEEIRGALQDDRKRIIAAFETAWAALGDKDWDWKESMLFKIRTGSDETRQSAER